MDPDIDPIDIPDAPDRATGSQQRLALIELSDRDGRVHRVVDVHAWPLTLGRAFDNDVVLDDPHVAPHHARIALDASADAANGPLLLQVLDTRNGVSHNGKRIAAGQPLALPAGGTTLQVGLTRVRLRLPGEVLAPERPLPGIVAGQGARLTVMALVLLVLVLAGQWIGMDPGTDTSAWLPMVLGVPLALAGWCGIWALMSKLFQHRFDFGGHLRIAIPWLLAMTLAEQLWPQLSAALGWPGLWQLSGAVGLLLAALLVRAHLVHVLPQHPRAVTGAVLGVAVAASAISLAVTWRANDSLYATPYMSTLPLPALRVSGSAPASALVQDMAPLAAKLAQRVRKARADDGPDDDDSAADGADDD